MFLSSRLSLCDRLDLDVVVLDPSLAPLQFCVHFFKLSNSPIVESVLPWIITAVLYLCYLILCFYTDSSLLPPELLGRWSNSVEPCGCFALFFTMIFRVSLSSLCCPAIGHTCVCIKYVNNDWSLRYDRGLVQISMSLFKYTFSAFLSTRFSSCLMFSSTPRDLLLEPFFKLSIIFDSPTFILSDSWRHPCLTCATANLFSFQWGPISFIVSLVSSITPSNFPPDDAEVFKSSIYNRSMILAPICLGRR